MRVTIHFLDKFGSGIAESGIHGVFLLGNLSIPVVWASHLQRTEVESRKKARTRRRLLRSARLSSLPTLNAPPSLATLSNNAKGK